MAKSNYHVRFNGTQIFALDHLEDAIQACLNLHRSSLNVSHDIEVVEFSDQASVNVVLSLKV